MAEKRQLEFFVLRYVPDAVKGEFVNIGLLVIEGGGRADGFADVRFTRDWRRVRCLDPHADIDVLLAIEREIRTQVAEIKDREILVKRLEDSFSNLIQLSAATGCLTNDPVEELKGLARLYLKRRKILPPSPEVEVEIRPRSRSGRPHILEEMKRAFVQSGVWKHLSHGIPMAPYSYARDPFKFDFGYRVGNEIKLSHAVSMRANGDPGLLLAARYSKIAPRMAELTNSTPILTAVVEKSVNKNESEIGFAWEMMESGNIRVATTADMPQIAEMARVEMRV